MNHAVQDFSVEIDQGEIIGLLGPNGAGKTTLMKMFTGIIVPSEGEINVLGFKPCERKMNFRKQIALVMGQKSQLWWDIPAMDSFLLLQRYYEINNKDFAERIQELSELLQVTNLLEIHVRKLSLGERMKMELMASLLHRPKIIFLDEPTIGLDVVAQKNVRAFLKNYHQQFRPTIILTSHYMADVAALCSRILLILGGEKRFDDSLNSFEATLGREKSVTFFFAESQIPEDTFWLPYPTDWNQANTQVELRIPEKMMAKVSRDILGKFPVIDFATQKLPIENVMETLLHNPALLETNPHED
jgi:ABC-2 type transport system ATP-binding protein